MINSVSAGFVRLITEIPTASDQPVAAWIETGDAAALGAFLESLWAWVLEVDRGMLPRVLRNPPNLETGVRVAPIVSRAYGHGIDDDAHTAQVRRLLEASHVKPGIDSAPEAALNEWDALPWTDAVLALAVDRAKSQSCALVADRLRKSGVSEHDVSYFTGIAEHGAADTRALLEILDPFVSADAIAGRLEYVARQLKREPNSWLLSVPVS